MQRTFNKKKKPGKKPEPKPKQFIDKSGNKIWKLNSKLHRVGKPAKEYLNGSTEWWLNGKRHREDGPAVNNSERTEWWLNGKRHREDGPAIILKHNDDNHYRIEYWYINGYPYCKDDFYRELYSRGKITKEELFIYLI